MLFDKIYNKRLIQAFNTEHAHETIESTSCKKLVKAKDGNIYLIEHFQYPEEYGLLSKGGKCFIYNNRMKRVGILKYLYEKPDLDMPAHMVPCDIEIKKRNIGLGSAVIKVFEKSAAKCGAHYIIGELSAIDEVSEDNRKLRDAFYIKHGYSIKDRKIRKNLID